MNSSRKIYLVRHGKPDSPQNEKYCLGQQDRPLGTLGKMQAYLLGEELKGLVPGGVFCSRLGRATETAAFLSPDYVIFPGLEEASAGEWDGLSFKEIEEKWPDIFEKRGEDTGFEIPGEEPKADAHKRFTDALRFVLLLTQGDIAVVSHTTVMGTLLAECAGEGPEMCRKYRMPYGSYCILEYNEDGSFSTDGVYRIPSLPLSEELCRSLRDAAGIPDKIKLHCDAVTDEALRICDELEATGLNFNRELIRQAAILHDIARLEKQHEYCGGEYLKALGYGQLGDIIRVHGELENEEIDEAAIVFIADKNIRETDRVSVEDRYRLSCDKCHSPEGLEVHERRMNQALRIKEKINSTCGKEVVI